VTPADARILKLVQHSSQTAFTVRIGSPGNYYILDTHYSFVIDGLTNHDIGKSLNNLERLGLLERRDKFQLAPVNDETEKT